MATTTERKMKKNIFSDRNQGAYEVEVRKHMAKAAESQTSRIIIPEGALGRKVNIFC